MSLESLWSDKLQLCFNIGGNMLDHNFTVLKQQVVFHDEIKIRMYNLHRKSHKLS